MATNVVMPQMGESIAEGTIVRWIKNVGDRVDRDEPLFEISTDKVDAEIPSPSAGVLLEIKVKEGETVPVDSVVALIGESGEAGQQATASQADGSEAPRSAAEPTSPDDAAPPAEAEAAAPAGPPPSDDDDSSMDSEDAAPMSDEAKDARRRQKSSPLVRKIAREHNVDLTGIPGTGVGGRVTKQDILNFIEAGPADRAAPAAQPPPVPAPTSAGADARPSPAPSRSDAPVFRPGAAVEVVPMSVMRRRIAEHMIASKHTSAHVHSVFEVDYTRVSQIREAKKSEFERAGVKLTYLAFIARAVVDQLRAMPVLNASIDGDNIVYHKDVNLGIAVALDWGLIVPVVKRADEKNVLGLARAIADLGTRARAKQLKPEEVQGGTFTITNPGVFGSLFGMPIINQPQVAILGVGAIEKRPVVISEAIAIRAMGFLTLGYDHRLVDGAVADQFMAALKRQIESFDAASM